ncbi:hypothetical protein ABZP36_017098 [Zizania latifolia]
MTPSLPQVKERKEQQRPVKAIVELGAGQAATRQTSKEVAVYIATEKLQVIRRVTAHQSPEHVWSDTLFVSLSLSGRGITSGQSQSKGNERSIA